MTTLSLITATFNAAETLADNIRCVAAQTVPVEHMIVDGGSRDNTMDVVAAHREHLAQVVSEPDDGLYDAMNKGVRMANGDVVGILNADDFYPTEDVLERVLEKFDDPDVGAVYGDLWYVEAADTSKVTRKWRAGEFDRNKFYWGWMPPHPTFFVRRELYDMYGNFNLALGSAADYELILRFLLKHKVRAAYVPKVLVHMRVGGVSNATVANRLAANRMDRQAWRVNGIKPYPWTIVAKPLRKMVQWL